MANYYTRSVITDTFLLTQEMSTALTYRGADTCPEGPAETILDGMVNERPPLRSYSITFEDGWSDYVECFDTISDWIEEEGHDPEDFNDETRRLLLMEKEDLLHEILKVNPDKDVIEMQSAWSCSKMRLDGFGGSGLIINRKGYYYLTTSNWEIDKDGTIRNRFEFITWESEQEESGEAA